MSNQQTQPQQNQAQKTASQRIEDLERGLMSMYQAFNGVAQDLNIAKEALKLLSNKVSSLLTVAQRGQPLTEENVTNVMIENNVEDLKGKIAGLISAGQLVPQDTIASDSFVVGRQLDDKGAIVNPRIQFPLGALAPAVQEKLVGRK